MKKKTTRTTRTRKKVAPGRRRGRGPAVTRKPTKSVEATGGSKRRGNVRKKRAERTIGKIGLEGKPGRKRTSLECSRRYPSKSSQSGA